MSNSAKLPPPELVSTNSLRVNDVLLGRGCFAAQYSGTAAFRRLVATRRSDYQNAETEAKKRVAREVMEAVHSGTGYDTGALVGQGGRFMMRVTDEAMLQAAGLDTSRTAEYWTVAPEAEAIRKCKMSLRQIDRNEDHKRKRQEKKIKQKDRDGATEIGSTTGSTNNDCVTASGTKKRSKDECSTDQVARHAASDTKRRSKEESSAARSKEKSAVTDRVATHASNDHSSTATLSLAVPLSGIEISFAGSTDLGVLGDCRPQLEKFTTANRPQQAKTTYVQPQQLSGPPLQMISSLGAPQPPPPPPSINSQDSTYPETTRSKHDNGSILNAAKLALEAAQNISTKHDAGLPYYADNTSQGTSLSGGAIRADLVALGSALFHSYLSISGRGTTMVAAGIGPYLTLLNAGLPPSLCLMVESLLDAEEKRTSRPYHTADDVVSDLKLMIDEPTVFLYENPMVALNMSHVRIDPAKLMQYGRKEHIALLMGAFDRSIVSGGPPEAVIVCGHSGTGKTTLLEQLYVPVQNINGGVILTKFEAYGQRLPLYVIFESINQYCLDLVRGCPQRLSQTRKALLNSLGSQFYLLFDLIPNLSDVLGEARLPIPEGERPTGGNALNMTLILLRAFFKAIASPTTPLILIFEDIHWADESSLMLLSTILADPGHTHFLFVATYRDEEVGPDHFATSVINDIASKGVPVIDIKTETLDDVSANNFISNHLFMVPRLTESLCEVILQKTDSNPLFITELLSSLFDERLITYSEQRRHWIWDIGAIKKRGISENVVDLVIRRIKGLDTSLRQILATASCLGAQCDEDILKELAPPDTSELDVALLLDIATQRGLFSKLEDGRYGFAHDKIQEAAYQMIPLIERDATHLNIGLKLLSYVNKKEDGGEAGNAMYIVADQLIRGSNQISTPSEKIKVAELCLCAGKKASSATAFGLSQHFLFGGVQLLTDDNWNDNYNLCLELFTRLGEAQVLEKQYENALHTFKVVFSKATQLLDKIPSYRNYFVVLTAQGKFRSLLDEGVEVLNLLGQRVMTRLIPRDPSVDDLKLAFQQCHKLSGKADNIMEKKETKDPVVKAIVLLINVLYGPSYRSCQLLNMLLGLLLVELAYTSGVCKGSALGFASLGMHHLRLRQYSEARESATVAALLLKKLDDRTNLPRVHSVLYGKLLSVLEPAQDCLSGLQEGYEVALANGGVDQGIYCGLFYCIRALLSGKKLADLSRYVSQVRSHAKAFRHEAQHLIGFWVEPAISNLTDITTSDPTCLPEQPPGQKWDYLILYNVYYTRLWLAYFFQDYKMAFDNIMLQRSIAHKVSFRPEEDDIFYSGLTLVAIAAEEEDGSKKIKWLSEARNALNKLQDYAKNSKVHHKSELLRAEILSIESGYKESTSALFENAETLAHENNYLHEEALACERASLYHKRHGDTKRAEEHLKRAKKLYEEWGAYRKVVNL